MFVKVVKKDFLSRKHEKENSKISGFSAFVFSRLLHFFHYSIIHRISYKFNVLNEEHWAIYCPIFIDKTILFGNNQNILIKLMLAGSYSSISPILDLMQIYFLIYKDS
jgi:hypothetical protein